MRLQLVGEMLLLLVIANGTPFVLHLLGGTFLDRPLDGGCRYRDARPLLGPSKTWRGMLGAVIATTLIAPLTGLTPLHGMLFGLLAMLGDLLSSFTKRRLNVPVSHSAPLLDQLPEALLPLLVLHPVFSATAPELVTVIVVFIVIDIAVSGFRDWWHR